MSESVLLWMFGGFLTAFLGLAGALWKHVSQCRSTNVVIAEIAGDVKRIKEDIGDHDKGMRRDIREHTSALFKLDAKIEALQRQERQR